MVVTGRAAINPLRSRDIGDLAKRIDPLLEDRTGADVPALAPSSHEGIDLRHRALRAGEPFADVIREGRERRIIVGTRDQDVVWWCPHRSADDVLAVAHQPE